MKARTGRNVTGRTQRKDRKGQAKHEPDFHFGLRKKARIRAFFLSRSALSLFFALFFLRAFALFFLRAFALFFSLRARERESAKKAPAPTSAGQQRWADRYFGPLVRCLADYRHVSGPADWKK
jgi:hypothetical protein